MRIGIIGISGRMGRYLVEETIAAGHEVAGGVTAPGGDASRVAATVFADVATLAAASDVVIDFSTAAAVPATARAMADAGRAWILGTTGLSTADEAAVAGAAETIPVVFSMNFSIGITLLTEVARRLGQALPAERFDAEIVEMHHRQKIDAPSGTAILLGRAVAKGRGVPLAEVIDSGRDGHTGARRTGAIGFSAVRAGQIVGDHSLMFASAAEHVTIAHRAFDRRIFANGAVLAAGWVPGRAAGLYDMHDVLA